jgi:GT2 family glycosyltransferase
VWCFEFEMAEPGTIASVVPAGPEHQSGRALVRVHGEPVGYVTIPLPAGGIDPTTVLATAWNELVDPILAHLAADGLRDAGQMHGRAIPAATSECRNNVVSDELVSVVVCTRNRPEILDGCLSRLSALTYPHLELIVVDNAPSDDRTEHLVERYARLDRRFRYVREPRPGLSAARNRGVREATGTYLAYTDDDVAVDRDWVQGLIRGFRSMPGVGCVTGLVCTASIEGEAEAYFDARASSWSTRCAPEIFDLEDHRRPSPLYPYSAGIFGTGANFAFDRAVFAQIGEFDEALGAGTRSRGGEDLDIFVRVLLAGHRIAYQPAAIVWHHHRAGRDELLKQMYGYGTGLSAFVAKCILRGATRTDVLRRIPGGLARMLTIRSQTTARMPKEVDAPRGAWRREVAGFLAGPLLYVRATRAIRR